MARGFGATLGSSTNDLVTATYTARSTVRSYHALVIRNGAGGGSVGRVMVISTSANANLEMISNTVTPDRFVFTRARSVTQGQWSVTPDAVSSTAWHSWGISYDDSSTTNDPVMYVDGTSRTVSEISTPDGTIDTTAGDGFYIGNSATLDRNWDGVIGEVAIWNAILTANEFAALAKGYSPALIRPASLVEYVPLVRSNVSYKLAAPTISGTVVRPHPRIIMPRGRRISYIMPPPLRQVHYRFRTDGDAADAAPTWGAAEDAGGYDPGASNFRLRVSVANTGAAVGAQPFELYLSKNSGAYAPITTTSTGGVKSADASTDADETIIKVPRLTPGT